MYLLSGPRKRGLGHSSVNARHMGVANTDVDPHFASIWCQPLETILGAKPSRGGWGKEAARPPTPQTRPLSPGPTERGSLAVVLGRRISRERWGTGPGTQQGFFQKTPRVCPRGASPPWALQPTPGASGSGEIEAWAQRAAPLSLYRHDRPPSGLPGSPIRWLLWATWRQRWATLGEDTPGGTWWATLSQGGARVGLLQDRVGQGR